MLTIPRGTCYDKHAYTIMIGRCMSKGGCPMPTKRSGGSHSTVIRCPNCGEDYSVTYKRCPFCDEKADVKRRSSPEGEGEGREEEPLHGGKRLARSGGSGGGKWPAPNMVLTILSLVVIAAAVWIVATQIVPLVNRSHVEGPDPSAPPASTQPVESLPATESPVPESTPPVVETETPQPSETIPAEQTATCFTLNRTEFTMSDRYPDPVQLSVTFTPAGTTGVITWTSSDPEVAAVDENGLVSHGTKNGTAVITATMAGGVTQECRVLCNLSDFSAGSSSSSSGSLSLNREDFTIPVGSSFRLQVSGTSSNPVWAIEDTSVATISGDGTVTGVGQGNTTVTCTVDGQTLTCIVRCS